MKLWMRSLTLISLAVVVFALGSCASIPTGGSVGTSQPSTQSKSAAPNNASTAFFDPRGPANGDSPTAIINGFINAAVGVTDSFQVARKFLAPDVSNTWKGSDRTVVFTGEPRISSGGTPGSYLVEVDVDAVVDADGILTTARPGSTEVLRYGLSQVNGQWRIGSLPQGVLLKRGFFLSLFQAKNLYFYDPTFVSLVPDARWLPSQSSSGQVSLTATLIVKALLNGPAPYLRGAVTSAFPDSVKLLRDSVPVSESQAIVDLTSKPLLDAGPELQRRMQQQLLTALQLAVGVTSVQMRADHTPVTFPSGEPDPALPVPAHSPLVDNRQIGVADDRLVWVENDTVEPVQGIPQFSAPPRYPAQSYQKARAVAFLGSDEKTLYTVVPGQTVLERLTDVPLTPPSFSPAGWVWSAAADGSGRVFAVNPGDSQQPISLTVDWLKGRTVSSLRISRDGARAMVVFSSGEQSVMAVSGILKRDNDAASTPRDLTQPQEFYLTESVSHGLWVGESRMMVFQPGDGPARIIEFSLKTIREQPASIDDLHWLSVGNSPSTAYAQTASGAVLTRYGNSWRNAAFSGVAELAFPG